MFKEEREYLELVNGHFEHIKPEQRCDGLLIFELVHYIFNQIWEYILMKLLKRLAIGIGIEGFRCIKEKLGQNFLDTGFLPVLNCFLVCWQDKELGCFPEGH